MCCPVISSICARKAQLLPIQNMLPGHQQLTMIICDIDFLVDICWPKFVSMSQGRIGFSFAKETGDLLAAHICTPERCKVTWHCCNISCMIPRSCPSVALYFPAWSQYGYTSTARHRKHWKGQRWRSCRAQCLDVGCRGRPQGMTIHGKNGGKMTMLKLREALPLNGEYGKEC